MFDISAMIFELLTFSVASNRPRSSSEAGDEPASNNAMFFKIYTQYFQNAWQKLIDKCCFDSGIFQFPAKKNNLLCKLFWFFSQNTIGHFRPPTAEGIITDNLPKAIITRFAEKNSLELSVMSLLRRRYDKSGSCEPLLVFKLFPFALWFLDLNNFVYAI